MDIKTRNTILGIALSVVLCIVIFFEFRTGFYMLRDHQLSTTQQNINLAANKGQAAVSIDEISVYDNVPAVDAKGDVIELTDYNVKLKINGVLTDDSMKDYGKYTYSIMETSKPTTLNVEHRTTNTEEFKTALSEFWHANPEALLTACNLSHDTGDVVYYQNTFTSGNVPVIYLGLTGMYYMFMECQDNGYLILSSTEPFSLSNEKVTVHFGKPEENPMLSHTYSEYETLAAENTIKELSDKDKEDSSPIENPYESTGVSGTADTYTSKADDEVRKQLATLANFEFKSDGTSGETTYSIDITSEEAKKSQWALTSTEYAYECKGLKLSMLAGKRSKDIFSLSGNINNTLDAERPYVIVVKYLDSNNGLLGISVVDKREQPLGALGVSTFSVNVNPTQNNLDIQKIASVMFEVY